MDCSRSSSSADWTDTETLTDQDGESFDTDCESIEYVKPLAPKQMTDTFDDEENVEEEVGRLDSSKSCKVTREYPDLIKLHPEALDAKDLEWVKRPTRKPIKLPPELSEGSRFLNFTENSNVIDMFLEYYDEPLEIVLSAMNDKNKEMFEQGDTEQTICETFSKHDLLAFTAAWLFMDCTPYRNRKEFWSTNRFR